MKLLFIFRTSGAHEVIRLDKVENGKQGMEERDNTRKIKTLMVQGTSLVVLWLRLRLSMQGVWVRSLVRKLRSHLLHGQKKEEEEELSFPIDKDFGAGRWRCRILSSAQ